MQISSSDKTLRSETVNDLQDFNSQSLATQAKKAEQLVSMMPATKKAFNLLGDDIVEISTKNDALKNKSRPYDEKWLEESEAKLLKHTDDEKKSKFYYVWKGKRDGKTIIKVLILIIINCGKANLIPSFRKKISCKT